MFNYYARNAFSHSDKKISEYIILLMELHNAFTLASEFKRQLKSDPGNSDLKKSLISAGNELRKINNKLLDYSSEFIYVSDIIENSRSMPQYLKIDSRLHTGYFNLIGLKIDAIRRQKFLLNNKIDELEAVEN